LSSVGPFEIVGVGVAVAEALGVTSAVVGGDADGGDAVGVVDSGCEQAVRTTATQIPSDILNASAST
jgi:hypothetical protein